MQQLATSGAEGGIFCHKGYLSTLPFPLSAVGDSFVASWAAFVVATLLAVAVTSGPLFYKYYWPSQVTFEKWQYKTNPKFPSPEKVRDEIIQMLKGLGAAALAPAASVCAARYGWSKGYCGSAPVDNPLGLSSFNYHVVTCISVVLISDFWEFYYHYLGHKYKMFWEQHKHHHKFFNPSPFAVIADEFVDQFFRALPMFLFPLSFPINIDMMFFMYGVFFYAYGCYLHWGYEASWPDAHHPVLNTAYHHYAHHARAIIGKPYHCGFFLKCWDQLFGSTYDGPCFCVKCEKKHGRRTREIFDTIKIPNYNKLLELEFWLQGGVLSGALSKDVNEDIKLASTVSEKTDTTLSASESAKEDDWAVSQKQ